MTTMRARRRLSVIRCFAFLLLVGLINLGTLVETAQLVNDKEETEVYRKLLMVQTLTRHGSRSPDKIIAQVSCKPLLNPDNEKLMDAFVNKFGTAPGELTAYGQTQMRQVGQFFRRKYADFVDVNNYEANTRDWQFIAREGSRQQRSMMGIVQGLFPNKPAVPIAVMERSEDAILGGPAPQCGKITAAMIVEWHNTVGKQLVQAHYRKAVKPFEQLCNISLIDNPVNAMPGGANPHAWIGDVSDLLDSMAENLPPSDMPKINPEYLKALTNLAFQLEQQSHYDDVRGDAMFAGEFPNMLISTFESIIANNNKRPSKVPKMRMHACSRELQYGLEHMMGWFSEVKLPGEPVGRIRPGSTLVWELWSDATVYTYLYQPGIDLVTELQPHTPVKDFRAQYENSIKDTGDWKKVCNVAEWPPVSQHEHSFVSGSFLFWLIALFVVGFIVGYRKGKFGGWMFGLIGGRRQYEPIA